MISDGSHKERFQHNLHHSFRFGKHKGQTVQWVIDNDKCWIKWALKKDLITLHPMAFDEYLTKLNPNHGFRKASAYGGRK